MLPSCITAFFNALAAFFNWRAKDIEWLHNKEIDADEEKRAKLVARGDPSDFLLIDTLTKQIRRKCKLVGALRSSEDDDAS